MLIRNVSLELSDRRVYHIGDHVRLTVHSRHNSEELVKVEGTITRIEIICNDPKESSLKVMDGTFGHVHTIGDIVEIEDLNPEEGVYF